RREVKGVNLGLGQVVPAGHIALLPRPREAWRGLDQLLLPRPREDGAQALARLIRRAARVRPFLGQGTLVDPVQELADLLVLQLLDRGAASPLLPFTERGKVFVPGAACHSLRAEITFYCSPEGGCHEGSSCAAGSGFTADSSWPAAL